MPKKNPPANQNDILEVPAPNFSVEQVNQFASDLYGIKGKLSPLDSERDQNFRIDATTGDQFVIKIANRAEDPDIIDLQLKAIEHIAKVAPKLPVPKVLLSQNGLTIEQIQDDDGKKHHVRLLSYLHGVTPREDPANADLHKPIGTCLSQLALALRGFFHPKAGYELLWDLKHSSKLRQYLPYITDEKNQELVSYFLDRFDNGVLPQIPKLRAQVVHNDISPDNILVAENDPGRIVGVIDFGDLTHTLLIVDLATTIAPMIRGQNDPVGVALKIISGYNKIIPLQEAELLILYDLVAMRLTMSIMIAAWRVTIHPDNFEYIDGNSELNSRTLNLWRTLNPAEVTSKFIHVCGLSQKEEDKPKTKKVTESYQSLMKRRTSLLGPNAYLFYKRPLHIVRGEGVWLHDAEGKKYLDVYNNVSHVGHCHPHVVKAITKQAGQLNTSTRYLHKNILDLAEEITSRLPDPLSVCTFVCTGTEANELAWRMAKVVSGNNGAIISKYSYHGNSTSISQFSTESISEENLPTHVETILPPTSNQDFPAPDSGINKAIGALAENGHKPAMLILDSSFVSDGIYTPPKDYLKMLFDKTRASGGLCVADEVQSGFGRFGHHFWGFQFDDVIPDIVTIGKPMGNGHPLAAVVTTPEIADAFAKERDYFNTFGGNPVSCAVGLAVLEVIEKEDLQENALVVGNYLKERLTMLRDEYPMIGYIHGAGLLLGIDVINHDGSPNSELAEKIMNHMSENGVLIGTTGPIYSILQIRPPLVFQKEHADILITEMAKALEQLTNT